MVWITLFFCFKNPTKPESCSFNIAGLFEAVKNNVRFPRPLSIEEFHPKYHKVDFLYYNLNSTKPLDPLVL